MRFRISLLHRSVSYWLVLGLFAAANAWSWLRYRAVDPDCCNEVTSVGFPFPFFLSDRTAATDEFLVFGFLLDIVIAWTLAVAVVWIALLTRGKSDL